MNLFDRISRYPRSSPYEKVLATTMLLAFVGIAGLILLDLHGILKIIVVLCLIVGYLVNTGAFFVHTWDRNRAIQRMHQAPNASFWLRVLTIVLWLGVLPFACLWVYHRLHLH